MDAPEGLGLEKDVDDEPVANKVDHPGDEEDDAKHVGNQGMLRRVVIITFSYYSVNIKMFLFLCSVVNILLKLQYFTF